MKLDVEDHGGGVWLLRLNDPDRRNALDWQLVRELSAAVRQLDADAARVVVVTGAGTAFCSGADLPQLFGGPTMRVDELREVLRDFYAEFNSLREMRALSIAAVHGAAVGAGVNVAMACDLRIFGPKGRFGVTFSRLGLHPGGGATFHLTTELGPQRTLKVLLDGGTILAPSALELGLAISVEEEPVTAALSLARTYSTLDPRLVRDLRTTVRTAVRGDWQSTLDAEAWAQAASAFRPDTVAAVAEQFRSAPLAPTGPNAEEQR